jgi:hypothetical protein
VVSTLALIAAGCGGGSSHVAVGPASTTPSSSRSGPTSTARAAAAKRAVVRGAAKPATKKKAGAKVAAKGSRTGVTLGTAGTGGTTPLTSAPQEIGSSLTFPTAGTTVTTAPPSRVTTPTTLPPPKPYDPTKPIDLGGEPGVTPAEQARAEQLVRDTLRDLPRYASPATAYAAGYRTIEDGATGTEHFVKWAYINDGHILDSQYPESLVYQWRNGVETLVSAMYILPFGTRFADAPDVGGALTQWHVHSNLCLVDNPSDPLQKVIGGFIGPGETCPAGSTDAGTTPMLHVWIVANPCGPFAPLEGLEAGNPPPGQTPLCDRGHGSN